MKFINVLLVSFISSTALFAQIPGGYSVSLEALEIPGIVGLHSYSFGTADGKWLVLGGRRDGLHARQPFNAFPEKLTTFVISHSVNMEFT
jgi:hypothetical protein